MLVCLIALFAALLAAQPAQAKGGSYLVGARIFGGSLREAVTTPIALPENYDDMTEADPPSGVFGSLAQSAGYHIELSYDFSADGYGTRTWLGWYDGNDRLWFTENMVVGPGTWAAGWYNANPLLADALRRALAPTAPSTGTGPAGRERAGVGWRSAVGLLALGGVSASLWLARKRAFPQARIVSLVARPSWRGGRA